MTKQWWQTKEGWDAKVKEHRKHLDAKYPNKPADTSIAKPLQTTIKPTRKIRPNDLVGSRNPKTGQYEPSKTTKEIARIIREKS